MAVPDGLAVEVEVYAHVRGVDASEALREVLSAGLAALSPSAERTGPWPSAAELAADPPFGQEDADSLRASIASLRSRAKLVDQKKRRA